MSRGSMFDELPGMLVVPLKLLLLLLLVVVGARDTRRFFAGVEDDIADAVW